NEPFAALLAAGEKADPRSRPGPPVAVGSRLFAAPHRLKDGSSSLTVTPAPERGSGKRTGCPLKGGHDNCLSHEIQIGLLLFVAHPGQAFAQAVKNAGALFRIAAAA